MAFYDLLARSKRLRARTLFIPAAAAIVLGGIGLVAHTTGSWSVVGRLADGSYFVSSVTVTLSFVVPAAPLMVAGFLAHAVLRRVLIRKWRAESMRKHRLSAEVLDACARGLP